MMYFFSVLLVITLLCGKAEGLSGMICLVIIDLSLILAVLRCGGYV